MARIRSIKPELADDEKLGSISRDARLLFIMMWCHSDDFGVVKGNLRWLQAQIFPYDPLKPEQFEKWIRELESIDSIRPFEANGEKFYYIKNFRKHQVINKPSKQARNPEPPEETLQEDSRSTTVVLQEDYAEEGKGREGNRKGKDIYIPDWISQEAWNGYLEMREAKKKKPTERALKLIIDKLDQWRKKGHDPTDILNSATVNGWTDVYEPKGAQNGRGQGYPQQDRTQAGGIRGDTSRFENTAEKFD